MIVHASLLNDKDEDCTLALDESAEEVDYLDDSERGEEKSQVSTTTTANISTSLDSIDGLSPISQTGLFNFLLAFCISIVIHFCYM
jgi:hypothetical protein